MLKFFFINLEVCKRNTFFPSRGREQIADNHFTLRCLILEEVLIIRGSQYTINREILIKVGVKIIYRDKKKDKIN